METLKISLTASILLCGLVSGLVLTFAIIVMPGIKSLSDHDFLQSFKAIDRIIQDNNPAFVFIWLGSILSILTLAGLSISQLEGMNRIVVFTATAIYLLGVQLPTFVVNVPLNNQLQERDLAKMSESELAETRQNFEPRWIKWNTIRTFMAITATVLLLSVVHRIGYP